MAAPNGSVSQDSGHARLHELGYKQEVKPDLLLLSNFAFSFSIGAHQSDHNLQHHLCWLVNGRDVIVNLPTLIEKDKIDILEWGVPNKIDMIVLSFVRKHSDLLEVRKVLRKTWKRRFD